MKILLLFIAAQMGLAATQAFDFALGGVSLEVPRNWNAAKGLYGIPLTILGPMHKGRRPGIYIVPLGRKGTLVDESKFQTSDKKYREGVQNWLTKNKGELLKFTPYKRESWPNAKEVHHFGVQYRTDEEFVEDTYYAVCKNRLYNVKTILTKQNNVTYASTVDSILRSFDC